MVVDLSGNSVACNSSVAVKCKETIERYPLMSRNLLKIPPDIEVLHVTEKSCNVSVACNTVFSFRIGPEHCPFSRKLTL
jgi:hypothetical protein